jgi:hypothetical protein
VYFEDDKEKIFPIRGIPFIEFFILELKAIDYIITVSIMDKYLKKELDIFKNYMVDYKKKIMSKDKDLKEFKALLKMNYNINSAIN